MAIVVKKVRWYFVVVSGVVDFVRAELLLTQPILVYELGTNRPLFIRRDIHGHLTEYYPPLLHAYVPDAIAGSG